MDGLKSPLISIRYTIRGAVNPVRYSIRRQKDRGRASVRDSTFKHAFFSYVFMVTSCTMHQGAAWIVGISIPLSKYSPL